MRGFRGYVSSRVFCKERVPQHVQNLVIRDYCARRGITYLLSATEYAMPNCYMMLEQTMNDLENLDGIKFSYNASNEITALYERKKHKIDQIISKVKSAGMEIYDISTDEGNLENVFIDLTKN